MQLSIYADPKHFIVHVDGQAIDLSPSPAMVSVDEGSIIRISTAYKRDFYVNSDAIGSLFDMDDKQFQNVFCIVPDCGKTTHGKLRIFLGEPGLEKESDDVYPYSTACAHVVCPDIIDGNWWHFLPCPADMVKMDVKTFRIMEKLFIIGFAYSAKIWPGYRYKIYETVARFEEVPDAVGVAYKRGDKTFALVEKEPGQKNVIAKEFDDINELYQLLKDRL